MTEKTIPGLIKLLKDRNWYIHTLKSTFPYTQTAWSGFRKVVKQNEFNY